MENMIKDSKRYLIEVNTKEYLELQSKFDELHKAIKIEQKALLQLSNELKNNRENFLKKQSTNSEKNLMIKVDAENTIEDDIDKMNTEIENFNNTIDSYNFISRF